MPKITQSDYEAQQLAYLRRMVDALEHISLSLLNIAQTQTQHPSIGHERGPDPMTIDVPHQAGYRGGPPKPMTQEPP